MSTGQLDALIDNLSNAYGENAEMARVRADNLGGGLKSLRSVWEGVGISVTDTNDGPLRELIQSITVITLGIGDWIKKNPKLAGTLAAFCRHSVKRCCGSGASS
ncbi:phage tail tape measure protein [Larsenimonas suaedae]|uniref:Phage tail tape measure protein n=1 Tax=Larsenimonas suaedae TaxID=1851019 RepID=A0ABU1GZB8_9GAMM|nr:phage tail tape measure protein [Larsenimonas suaedae]MCM2973462.1 phage tail tape measure protein [Larsenimonas suaedae]MDR5897363.1 phage tail tape measure protein [Larsenimonas suaedae]